MKYFANFRHSLNVLVGNEFFHQRPATYIVRCILWYLLVGLKREPSVGIKEWGANFILPSIWRTPAKLFYVFRKDYEEEIHFFEKITLPGDYIVDVGANVGLYSILAGKKAGPEGRVLAFEPFPASLDILRRNRAHNGLDRMMNIFPIALGAARTKLALSVHSDPGRNSFGELGQDEITRIDVPVDTLDNVLSELNPPKIDFIKMDVEGFEKMVLEGGQNSLSHYKPTIVFELNPDMCKRAGYDASEIVQFLQGLGYRFFAYDRGFELTETIPEKFGNYVAVHQERLMDIHFKAWQLHLRAPLETH